MIPGFETSGRLSWLPRPQAILGEGPVWNERENRLYWLDADQRQLMRVHQGSGATESIALTHAPGSFAFCSDERVLMASRNELALLTLATGEKQVLPVPGLDFANERFNDGACDRRGRFWVGTMDKRMAQPLGSLYRVDADLGIRRMATGFAISNGIAFSPDDRLLYHTESRTRRIVVHDFDLASGDIANPRVFLELGADQGNPDGCTVDAEGCLWVAQLGAWRVSRFDPQGQLLASLPLPTARPTSVAFGGQDLDILFITTMRHDLNAQELEDQPLAGSLFAFTPGVRGLHEPRFAA